MGLLTASLHEAGIQDWILHMVPGKPDDITSWTEQLQIFYLRNFFLSRPRVEDIQVPEFLKQSFERFYPIAMLFGINVLTQEEYLMLSTCPPGVMLTSYSDLRTFSANMAKKQKQEDKKMQDAGNPFDDENPYGRMQQTRDVVFTMLQWPDMIDAVSNAMIKACDYIMKEFVDEALVQEDITYKKFPQVVDFFNLDHAGEELTRFFMTFRSTQLCISRDTRNFKVRINQFARFTALDEEKIKSYAAIYRKTHEFLPFIVEAATIPDSVWNFLRTERVTSLIDCFYTIIPPDGTLPKSYFPEMSQQIELILRLISAQKTTKRPRHILLYGEPGTGKTSFVKTICHLAKRRGYMITTNGQDDNNRNYNSNVPSSESRLLSIRICDDRVKQDASIIVVDEADDLINCEMQWGWGSTTYDTRSKTLLNQVMDNTTTPCIWITNNQAHRIDPSCRRRFDYSIRFSQFTAKQREIIWRNCIKQNHLQSVIPKAKIPMLAEKYPVSPGGIANACLALIDLDSTAETAEHDIDQVMQKHCELLGIDTQAAKTFVPCKQYTLDGLNITGFNVKDLENICRQYETNLANGKATRPLSILLKGYPGTGKTELVKYLGSVLKKTVKVTSAETFLDMYVGQTEHKIAEVFEEAERSGQILFIDEIDALMFPRGKAHQSWQVSQVTTLLTCMEKFRGIFIGATNHAQMNDSASVRRFAFKLQFNYLTSTGMQIFMAKYFPNLHQKQDPSAWAKILALTDVGPGDFSTVAMLADYSTDKLTLEWVLNALRHEVDEKHKNFEYGEGSLRIGY